VHHLQIVSRIHRGKPLGSEQMKPLTEFNETSIYLDTMVPYIFLRGIDPAIKPFFARLERGEFTAYTSALTFDELAYRLLLALIKDQYGGSPLNRYRDETAKMLEAFAPKVVSLLRDLRGFPYLIVLDVLVTDLNGMEDMMAQYQLAPRDALHIATMQRAGCLAIASNDAYMDRIPHLQRFGLPMYPFKKPGEISEVCVEQENALDSNFGNFPKY
jgi:predicted nucleic acid-binding protein